MECDICHYRKLNICFLFNEPNRLVAVSVGCQSGGSPWSTAIGMTFNWALGTGTDYRVFKNDAIANSFRDVRVVNQAREYWYKKVNAGDKTIYDGLTNFLGKESLEWGEFWSFWFEGSCSGSG